MADFEKEIVRGRDAESLMTHPLLIEAFDKIYSELLKAWFNTPVRDFEGRESLYIGVHMLEKIKFALTEHVTTGKMAAIQLQSEVNNVTH